MILNGPQLGVLELSADPMHRTLYDELNLNAKPHPRATISWTGIEREEASKIVTRVAMEFEFASQIVSMALQPQAKP